MDAWSILGCILGWLENQTSDSLEFVKNLEKEHGPVPVFSFFDF
jgi:hypothetical protein